jgi:glycosyltransferase involved in cell wall biosynthesis
MRTVTPPNGTRSLGKNFLPALRAFRELQPHTVLFHCPSYRWGLDVIMAAELARIPRILRMEHNPIMAAPEWYLYPLLRLLDAKFSGFFYVSEGNRRRFEMMLSGRKGRGRVLYNCYNQKKLAMQLAGLEGHTTIRDEFGLPPASKLALFAASYWGIYDEDFRRPIYPILKAFQNLLNDPVKAKAAEAWQLLISGSGDERAADLICEMGLSSHVVFIGPRSDLPLVMKQCNLLVSASHFEGAPLTNLEAWAMNLPVLSTQVDGITDIIGEEATRRFMVPQGDTDAFARAWYDFMIEEPERLAIQRKASEVVRSQHNTQMMKKRLVQVYQEILLPA